jgi:hypothetical protein
MLYSNSQFHVWRQMSGLARLHLESLDDKDGGAIFVRQELNDRAYTNLYLCPNDNMLWADDWSCMCNDRCPECNAEIEPFMSRENATATAIVHAGEVLKKAREIPNGIWDEEILF